MGDVDEDSGDDVVAVVADALAVVAAGVGIAVVGGVGEAVGSVWGVDLDLGRKEVQHRIYHAQPLPLEEP